MNVHVPSTDLVCYSQITAQPATNVSYYPLAWFRPCISSIIFFKDVDYRKDKGNGLGLYLCLNLHPYLPQAILWTTLYHISTHLILVCFTT